MKVNFIAPQKLGNKFYPKGQHIIPDHLAHNLGFKALVKSGIAHVIPRDDAMQKIQLSKDAKAVEKAKLARKARQALQSAQAASDASSIELPSAVGSDQALLKPAKPVSAGAVSVEAKLKAPANALKKERED